MSKKVSQLLSPEWTKLTIQQAGDLIFRTYVNWLEHGVRQAVYLESEPGSGKTAVWRYAAERIAEYLGKTFVPNKTDVGPDEFGFLVLQWAMLGEEVAAGMPWVEFEKNVMRRAMSDLFPRSGQGLWLMDEPFHATWTYRFVGPAISDRRMLSEPVPDGWLIGLAGNNAKDRAGATRIPTHTGNRIMWVRVESEAQVAMEHFQLECSPEIRVFLTWFPERLTTFDPQEDGPFGSARSWDLANNLCVSGADPVDPVGFAQYQGLVGLTNALNLRVMWRAISSLPNLDEMLAHPKDWDTWMAEQQSKDATVVAAVALVVLRSLDRERDVVKAARAIELFGYASRDVVAMFLSVAKQIDARHDDKKSVLDQPQYATWAIANKDVLF